jgi:hypothetical protein
MLQLRVQLHASYFSVFSSTLFSSVISIILLHYKYLAQLRPVFWLENLLFGKFVEKCPTVFQARHAGVDRRLPLHRVPGAQGLQTHLSAALLLRQPTGAGLEKTFF